MAMQSLPPALAGLANYSQFVIFKVSPDPKKPGKFTKVPISPATGHPVNPLDPAQWLSAAKALAIAVMMGDEYAVGFTLTKEAGFWVIDADGAWDGEQWSSTVQDLFAILNGAAFEVSSSRNGAHFWGRGQLPPHRSRGSHGLECYDCDRAMVVTGLSATGSADYVISPPIAAQIVGKYFAPNIATDSVADGWTSEPVPEWHGPTDDQELLKRACRSRSASALFGKGASFNQLWTADEEALARAYPSSSGDSFDRSSADAALALMLSFWTGRNAERIRTLMLQSALNRTKWEDRPEYLDTTILGAVQMGGDVCQDRAAISGLTSNGTELVIDAEAGRSISTLDPLPHTTLSGKPKPVVENYAEVLRRAGVVVRYDVIRKCVEVLIPGHSYHTDKGDVAKHAWLSSISAHYGLPRDGLSEYVTLIASQNLYNPALTWIESKPWDGKSRLPEFFDTITPKEDTRLEDGRRLRDVLMLRWMLSAVAAVAGPDGFAAQGMLVITGAQGIGKSRWVESLAPTDLGLVRLGALVRPDDRDSIVAAVRAWITEIGELDGTLRKADVAQLKAFISNPVDTVRLPYERAESKFARRTVFVATCNHSAFLIDETGNRKFWVIAARAVNADHDFDMQQVWAEVLHLWRSGQPAYLLPDERAALDASNDDHTVIDPVEDRLATRLDWDADRSRWTWRSVTDILASVGVDRPSRSDVTRTGVVLERMGAINKKSNGVRYRLVPPVVSMFHLPGAPSDTTGAAR